MYPVTVTANGVAKGGGGQGAQGPESSRQNISIRMNCMKFANLVSFAEEIIKIVATRAHLLKLKCTKFNFGWIWEFSTLTQIP